MRSIPPLVLMLLSSGPALAVERLSCNAVFRCDTFAHFCEKLEHHIFDFRLSDDGSGGVLGPEPPQAKLIALTRAMPRFGRSFQVEDPGGAVGLVTFAPDGGFSLSFHTETDAGQSTSIAFSGTCASEGIS